MRTTTLAALILATITTCIFCLPLSSPTSTSPSTVSPSTSIASSSPRSKREDPGYPYYFRNFPFVRSISYLSEIPRGLPFLLIAYNPGCGRCARAIPQFAGAAALLLKRGIPSGALSIYYSNSEYNRLISGLGWQRYPTIVFVRRSGQIIHYNGRDPVFASMWDFYHFAMTNNI